MLQSYYLMFLSNTYYNIFLHILMPYPLICEIYLYLLFQVNNTFFVIHIRLQFRLIYLFQLHQRFSHFHQLQPNIYFHLYYKFLKIFLNLDLPKLFLHDLHQIQLNKLLLHFLLLYYLFLLFL